MSGKEEREGENVKKKLARILTILAALTFAVFSFSGCKKASIETAVIEEDENGQPGRGIK